MQQPKNVEMEYPLRRYHTLSTAIDHSATAASGRNHLVLKTLFGVSDMELRDAEIARFLRELHY